MALCLLKSLNFIADSQCALPHGIVNSADLLCPITKCSREALQHDCGIPSHVHFSTDLVQALRLLAKDKSIPNVLTGIAYNPYLPNDKDYREEKARLEAKLGSGFPVAAIYLQVSSYSCFYLFKYVCVSSKTGDSSFPYEDNA